MTRLGMEFKEVSPLEYGVHQPGHEAVNAGMNAQQVEELTDVLPVIQTSQK